MTRPLSSPPGGAEAARLHVLGNLLTFHLRTADTAGALTLVECETLPGAGTPPHIQDNDAEAFFVLEGRYEFTLDDRTESHGPGGVVRVASGQVHGFRNPGDTPARMLILNWPGGPHEAFFEAVGEPVAPGAMPVPQAPDMGRILAAAQAAGITLLPPQ